MLTNAITYPTIPVTDLLRAREFYEKKLGLKVSEEMPQGLVFKAGDTMMYIYRRDPSKADHTLAGFRVEDIEKTVAVLSQNGIRFEQYDYPNLKTDEKGIATTPPVKAAWFKDPDGNILGITEEIEKTHIPRH